MRSVTRGRHMVVVVFCPEKVPCRFSPVPHTVSWVDAMGALVMQRGYLLPFCVSWVGRCRFGCRTRCQALVTDLPHQEVYFGRLK